MFFGYSELRRYLDTLRLDLRLVRALAESGWISCLSASFTVACDYLEIGRPHFLNGGLHLGCEGL